jgi:hypothetical protein
MSPYAPPIHFHKHDGFFLRFGLGVGYFSSSGSASETGFADSNYTVKGGALALDISIGGAVAPGVILAASLTGTSTGSATVHTDGFPDTSSSAALSALGLMVDYYPNPAEGFHLGGALSIAGVSYNSDSQSNNNDDTRAGGAISGHIGYEWWVGTDWSIGLMGRITYAHATRRIDVSSTTVNGVQITAAGSQEWKDSVVSPAVLFVATYN